MDEADESTPFVSQAEVEINEILGLFDVPAFARRGQELEYAIGRLQDRLTRERLEMLDMVRLRLRQWALVATGPADGQDMFAEPISRLMRQVNADVPVWSKSPASSRQRKAAARDLLASVERFNRRWGAFLEGLDLVTINRRIDHYNRYYVLEKECVIGSARLAARHFVPKTYLTRELLLIEFPLLSL